MDPATPVLLALAALLALAGIRDYRRFWVERSSPTTTQAQTGGGS